MLNVRPYLVYFTIWK